MERTKQEELSKFTENIFKEAESSSGTWSLATYNHFREKIVQFRESEVEYFFGKIINAIVEDEIQYTTRYKLAQLCSISHTTQLPLIEAYFKQVRGKIDALSKPSADDPPLLIASDKLLRSLYEEPAKRRFSAQPRVINVSGRRSAHQSKTPEPKPIFPFSSNQDPAPF